MKQVWKHKYQIREKLGQGSGGQVYRVWDLHLAKEWAMKELDKDSQQELHILSHLSHPRFPRVVDAFTEETRQFIVMDYLEGITLEELLKRGAIEEKRLIDLAGQVAQALQYLHEKSPTLLYMDLKPSNILLDEQEEVKLVDLGSVIIKGKAGPVSGTLGFASPEQIRIRFGGKELNEQSDIFSLGMLMFAMATGNLERLPVIEEGSRHGIYVRRYNPLICPELEEIIEVCTRGEQNRRYISVRDVKQSLETVKKRKEKKSRGWLAKQRVRRGFLSDWQQEKSLICTRGKTGLYISGRSSLLFFLFFLGILASVSRGLPFPAKYSLAQERQVQEYQVQKYQSKIVDRDELGVIIRDGQGRKVLVKEGAAYKTKDNLMFEIPWESVLSDNCKITILCEETGGNTQYFQMECIKK